MKLIKVKCKDGLTKEQYEQKYKEFGKVFGSSRFLGGCTGWGGDFAEFENSDINPFVELLKDGSIQVEYWGEKDRIKKKFASNVSCRQVANFLKNEEKNFGGFE